MHTAIGAHGLLVRQTSRHTLLMQTCVVKQSGSMTHCGRAVIGAIGVQTASCSCTKQSEFVSHGIRLHTLTQRRFTHFSSKAHSPLVAHPTGKGASVDGSAGGSGSGSFIMGGCVSDRGKGVVDVTATGLTGCWGGSTVSATGGTGVDGISVSSAVQRVCGSPVVPGGHTHTGL